MVLRSRDRPRVYELAERIGVGGMGEVYKGTTPDLNRKVAVKRMLDHESADEDLKALFLREVAVAATLEHHNVVEVLDAGQAGPELYLVMEFVDGPALAEIVEVLRRENKILPIEVSCGIVSSVALGLRHAHERALPDGTPLGIVHRDVAPENVLIGSEGIPKIVDFGLATLAGHSLTEPGIIRGRPRALSPEQARGDPTDVRSDIFSLGAMLFELVAGQSLYPNEAIATLLWKVAAGDYAPLEPRLTHVDSDLVELIQKALAVESADRFRSAREMERALDHFRAARGMRMSSRALAQVVSMTWPQIQQMRKERIDGDRGELEGARLVLPADQLDWDFDQPRPDTPSEYPIPQARIEGSERSAAATPSPSTPAPAKPPLSAPDSVATPAVEPKPKSNPAPARVSSGIDRSPTSGELEVEEYVSAYPKPNLSKPPTARRRSQSGRAELGRLEDQSEASWAMYFVAVVAVAAAAFAWVWSAHGGP